MRISDSSSDVCSSDLHPPADADVDELALGHHWAQHRLAFEELLTHQLSQQRLRESLRSLRAPAMPKAKDLPARYLANLGFAPTGAQQRVGNEIAYDLSQPEPRSEEHTSELQSLTRISYTVFRLTKKNYHKPKN